MYRQDSRCSAGKLPSDQSWLLHRGVKLQPHWKLAPPDHCNATNGMQEHTHVLEAGLRFWEQEVVDRRGAPVYLLRVSTELAQCQ